MKRRFTRIATGIAVAGCIGFMAAEQAPPVTPTQRIEHTANPTILPENAQHLGSSALHSELVLVKQTSGSTNTIREDLAKVIETVEGFDFREAGYIDIADTELRAASELETTLANQLIWFTTHGADNPDKPLGQVTIELHGAIFENIAAAAIILEALRNFSGDQTPQNAARTIA